MMKRKQEYDAEAQRELKLFMENDSDLYRQRISPINKNLVNKMAKGVYHPQKAEKLWSYAVEEGRKKYEKEYGGKFTVQDRRAVAKTMERNFRNEAGYGNYDNMLMKKYQKKKEEKVMPDWF
jgi:hypothetical protein